MNYINRNEKIYGVKIFITNFKFLMSQCNEAKATLRENLSIHTKNLSWLKYLECYFCFHGSTTISLWNISNPLLCKMKAQNQSLKSTIWKEKLIREFRSLT